MPKGGRKPGERFGGRTSDEWGTRVPFSFKLSPMLRDQAERFAQQDGVKLGEWIHRQIVNAVVERQYCENEKLAEISE